MAEAIPKSDIAGLRFGRYELLLKMASGGMATLYLARITGPEKFEKLLCIKRVHDHLAEEREFTDMFLDECRIAALIHHPNVATVFDMGKIQGAYFMALEYVHGHDLREVLAAAKRLPDSMPWAYAVRIVADAAAGLHAAHELKKPGGTALGVVHRDVSHQNILVSYDGIAKVVDFGVAYARERISSTGVKTLKGKIAYMSPEQSEQRPLDRRSDVFSLGVVLFEAVCLRRLFKSPSEVETILKVREARVPSPRTLRPDIPERLERIIFRALAKDPDERYQSAAQLQGALEALLVEEGKVVGPQQVSDLMDRLFHSKREEKDRRIEEALLTGNGMNGPSLSFSGPGEGSLPSAPSELYPKRSWLREYRGLIIGAAGGFVVVMGAVLLAFYLGRGDRTSEASPPSRPALALTGRPDATVPRRPPSQRDVRRPPPAGRDAQVPATVSIVVKVTPAKARPRVRFRGKDYHGATFRAQVRRTEQEETVEVTAKGYESQSLVVVPLEDRTFKVKLERKRRRHHHRRRRRIQWKALPD